jgi:hypothetical protein
MRHKPLSRLRTACASRRICCIKNAQRALRVVTYLCRKLFLNATVVAVGAGKVRIEFAAGVLERQTLCIERLKFSP